MVNLSKTLKEIKTLITLTLLVVSGLTVRRNKFQQKLTGLAMVFKVTVTANENVSFPN